MGAISRFLFLMLPLAAICSCTQPVPQQSKKYSIMVMSDEDKQYIIQTDTLDHGTAYPIRDGVLVASPPRIWYYTIVKDGYYYFVSSQTHYFVKNQVIGNKFVAIDSVLLPGFRYPDNCVFYTPDSVLVVNSSKPAAPKQYARINVKTMQATIGELPIPAPQPPFKFMSVGFVQFRSPYCWIGYTYHYQDETNGYGSSDTVYLAQTMLPGMQLQQIIKDARSTYPGNVNTAQQNTFEDEAGDFYFLSCPGIVRGANPSQPTAIYRMKAGAQALDSSYFFNISASAIHNHAYGLWYIGYNEAIIRSERKDLFGSFEEHYKVPHIEYYVINLLTKTVQKLDLPLDRGSSRTCVLAEGPAVYISINDGKGGNDIWIYNKQDRSVRKGLHLDGPVNYIMRLESLH
ncbi:hypothetical protein SAMN05428949_1087 [Chitinophaga sp. YR627]|uniref:hypothetical protein n=1 Tax=Chitinophaga sp. YR627 TaxID=1881041 RepID=UPI0008E79492|nr:hypothetical protein [Chitinophaga sp. YR627]SFM86302.1 hypothetical protein SAMN05428949_1087 [Chitinophaga sp. YR627]